MADQQPEERPVPGWCRERSGRFGGQRINLRDIATDDTTISILLDTPPDEETYSLAISIQFCDRLPYFATTLPWSAAEELAAALLESAAEYQPDQSPSDED
jgi:hypothetical protein